MSLEWLKKPVHSIDNVARQDANARQAILTKPAGSLGMLETLAVQFSAWQGTIKPELDRVHISIFAADHGVAEEGVSAFPQVVTGEMVKNFVCGGAAISVLAKENKASLEIIDVGVKSLPELDNVINANVANATQNIAKNDAMDAEQLQRALQVGKDAAERAKESHTQLFIGGEMGIANTTSATAMSCQLLGFLGITEMTGAGTGLDQAGIKHKAEVITSILARYNNTFGKDTNPLTVLRVMGGFEIAALSAAYIRCGQLGIPVLVDGFITTAAALLAIKMNKGVEQWMIFSHCSAESGHTKILAALGVKPLLNLEMRLGEASGAAMVIPVIKHALALHNNMATFAEAEVSS
ncbi:MAG: nicotinate-nucleotide--dimethylbenzimidazole phosphoribosyltransferase [Aquificaceae bacterium]|nr:MAG: nicotinate-nucleotide--dimethylbenzimidazole phosphoribosyltransferase [Aquificaceae bacterium]